MFPRRSIPAKASPAPKVPLPQRRKLPESSPLTLGSTTLPRLVPMMTREQLTAALKPAVPFPGVVPKDREKVVLAMDDAFFNNQIQPWMANSVFNYAFIEGYTFLGFPFLSQLMQIAEYRILGQTIAEEATRKWIEVKSISDDESKSDAIKELENEMERLGVRDVFKTASEHDSFFGRAHIYIDTGHTDDPDELKLPIGDGEGDDTGKKFEKGFLRGFKNVEPMWTYPARYNASDPLADDWYKPKAWFVNGKELDQSRLLTLVSRPVPDIFKPSFAFGGLSLTQMAKPYIDNWLNTRQAVADIIQAFSVMVLSTDLDSLMEDNGAELLKRISMFNQNRRNNGVLMIDKNSEEFKNIAAPLGTLDGLQAQSQEHIATVAQIPLVKLFGIQPTGLNASSEGEIRVFYDREKSYQEAFFDEPLTLCFKLCQINLWGKIDDDLVYAFKPLWETDDIQASQIRKTDAETDGLLIDKGVLNPKESRQRIADDPDQPYGLLDVEDLPEAMEPEPENVRTRIEEQGGEAPPADGEQPDTVGQPKRGERDAA